MVLLDHTKLLFKGQTQAFVDWNSTPTVPVAWKQVCKSPITSVTRSGQEGLQIPTQSEYRMAATNAASLAVATASAAVATQGEDLCLPLAGLSCSTNVEQLSKSIQPSCLLLRKPSRWEIPMCKILYLYLMGQGFSSLRAGGRSLVLLRYHT